MFAASEHRGVERDSSVCVTGPGCFGVHHLSVSARERSGERYLSTLLLQTRVQPQRVDNNLPVSARLSECVRNHCAVVGRGVASRNHSLPALILCNVYHDYSKGSSIIGHTLTLKREKLGLLNFCLLTLVFLSCTTIGPYFIPRTLHKEFINGVFFILYSKIQTQNYVPVCLCLCTFVFIVNCHIAVNCVFWMLVMFRHFIYFSNIFL